MLNAFKLNVFAAVEISWTYNVSEHMLLTHHCGQHLLKIFALPCIFECSTIASTGISQDLIDEIQASYGILFNAWPEQRKHASYLKYLCIPRICWCWTCSSRRFRKRTISSGQATDLARSKPIGTLGVAGTEFDPVVAALMEENTSVDWLYEDFPCLWPRIIALENHLRMSRPWSIWILFRDRRDTVQFWTFL